MCVRVCRPDNKVAFDKDVDYLQMLSKDDFVPLEVPSGSLVLLHGANVHFSYENTSGKSRHAYSMHVIEGAPSHTYAPNNWWEPQLPDLLFSPQADSILCQLLAPVRDMSGSELL